MRRTKSAGKKRSNNREVGWAIQGAGQCDDLWKGPAAALLTTHRRDVEKGAEADKVLSTAATPVSTADVATPENAYLDPFARIAPSACAVCLLEGDESEAGELLCCDRCQVQVHRHCWGRVNLTEHGVWRCDKCRDGCHSTAACSLCPSQGGCLKKTVSGDWVHVQCALW